MFSYLFVKAAVMGSPDEGRSKEDKVTFEGPRTLS